MKQQSRKRPAPGSPGRCLADISVEITEAHFHRAQARDTIARLTAKIAQTRKEGYEALADNLAAQVLALEDRAKTRTAEIVALNKEADRVLASGVPTGQEIAAFESVRKERAP